MQLLKRWALIFIIATIFTAACLIWLGGPVSLGQVAGPDRTTPSLTPSAMAALSQTTYLPLVASANRCPIVSNNSYQLVPLLENTPRPAYPAQSHADLNLKYRSYRFVSDPLLALLVDPPVQNWVYPITPTNAPKLTTLFAANPLPDIKSAYQIYDWDWSQGEGGSQTALLANWETTLIGLDNTAGTVVRLPRRNDEIYQGGFNALVLYADEQQLTVTYEHTDSVAIGYTLHLENLCVDANLLALYRAQIGPDGLRLSDELPGLRSGDPIGMTQGAPLRVATRYYGNFMDPRSANVWWLNQLGNITGTVYSVQEAPLAGIEVQAYQFQNNHWVLIDTATTNQDGAYALALTEGVYRVAFVDPTGIYLTSYYDEANDLNSAQDIGVTAESTTSGIDAFLVERIIVVDTTEDDRVDNGNCTLREAIIAANTDTQVDGCQAGQGADTIRLSAGFYGLFIPNNDEDAALAGDLDITDELTILGDGIETTIVDGAQLGDRVFHILNTTAFISGITIQNGQIFSGTPQLLPAATGGPLVGRHDLENRRRLDRTAVVAIPNGQGGGIFQNGGQLTLSNVYLTGNYSNNGGGGIFNQAGQLTLIDATVAGNFDISGFTESGGGIFNANGGTLTLIDSNIVGNQSNYGGGIDNFGSMTVERTSVSGNRAFYSGGAIWSSNKLTLIEARIEDNIAASAGGGIYNLYGTSMIVDSSVRNNQAISDTGGGLYNSGLLSVSESAILSNTAVYGGGLYNATGEPQSIAVITNATLSGNFAQDSGAIYNNAVMTLTHATIVANHGFNNIGGINNFGTTAYRHSIIAGNTSIYFDSDCGGLFGTSFTSLGYNLLGVETGCDVGTTDLTVDSGTLFLYVLGPLQLNAPGNTETYALPSGSLAIDAVNPAACPPPGIDQRGVARPQGASCDIGAYEAP